LSALLKRLALRLWRPIERRAAGAYLAGARLSDALAAGDRIAARGYGIVIGFWNADDDAPERVAAEDVTALEALGPRGASWYLSVKAPALGYSGELVGRILGAAAPIGAIVHFDSHGPETAERTLALALEARAAHEAVGITVPGRWRRSLSDAERAAEGGLRVRVVKGEWADPDEPEIDMREGFLAVVDRLAGRAAHVCVATHDAQLAREAVGRLAASGTPHDLELLVGLPFEPAVEVARGAGLPVRVYVPYGHASLRYGLGYLRRNPRRVWWLVRDLLLRRRRATPPAIEPQRGPSAARSQ
jgi:proline dehydrogenase